MRGLEGFLGGCALLVEFLDCAAVALLESGDLSLEVRNHLALGLLELGLLVSEGGTEVYDSLFELRDAFLELHLEEFLVAVGVTPHLVKHLLVLVLEGLQLTLVPLVQFLLHIREL